MIEDVEQLFMKYGVQYIKKGKEIKCLCPNPSHNDKHIGSFSYDTSKGLGHCFACHFSCNIRTLNKILGEKVGKPTNSFFSVPLRTVKQERKIYDIKICGSLKNPFENYQVMNFLQSIGYSDKFVKFYDIKYSSYSEMISSELYEEENPTKIVDRIVIPIKQNGKIVSYECRTFNNAEPKVLYPKGSFNNCLFNIDNIDKNKMVVLTESIKNLGKGWNVYKNIISSFGNQLTEEKMKQLNEIPQLTLFMDYDEGGLQMLNELLYGVDGKFEKYKGELYVTYCSKKYKDSNGKTKGYDMNDLSLEQIRHYIMNAKKAEEMIKDKIVW